MADEVLLGGDVKIETPEPKVEIPEGGKLNPEGGEPKPEGGEVILNGQVIEEPEPEPKPEGGEGGEGGTEGEEHKVEKLEINFEGLEDVVDVEEFKGIIERVNKGELNAQDLIKEFIENEKKSFETERATSETIISNIKKSPPQGIDLKELNTWVLSQGNDFAKSVGMIVNTANGEEVMRAGIEMLNKLRLDKVGKIPDVGTDNKALGTDVMTEDSFLEDYERIYMAKRGKERLNELMLLKSKAKKTGNKELIELANAMLSDI
jgi:hypothetical protein